jgi:4-hydroxy-tetrahydrodipicolinate reductase
MGREVELQASRRGHRLVRIVDPSAPGRWIRRRLAPGEMSGVDVALEFTRGDQAEANVLALLESGTPVVSGTTGWTITPAVRRAARRRGVGAVIAPNLSIGMNLFYGVVREASLRLVASGLYDPFVVEWHHRRKLDAPSGTARVLASLVAAAAPAGGVVHEGHPDRPLAPGAVHVVSVRAGSEPGMHAVGFDGEHDVIELRHRSRGRSGFALGAVLAAEWIVGRRGLHGFDRVLRDLLARSRRQAIAGRAPGRRSR